MLDVGNRFLEVRDDLGHVLDSAPPALWSRAVCSQASSDDAKPARSSLGAHNLERRGLADYHDVGGKNFLLYEIARSLYAHGLLVGNERQLEGSARLKACVLESAYGLQRRRDRT